MILPALALMSVWAESAAAAETTLYPLPVATHAYEVAPTGDGSVWFSPTHGEQWTGDGELDLWHLTSGGAISESAVPGVQETATGLDGAVWFSFQRKNAAGVHVIGVGLLGPSGEAEKEYVVGLASGQVESVAPGREAVWVVHDRHGGRDSIARVSAEDGAIRQFTLGRNCESTAIVVAPNGTPWFTETCERLTEGGGWTRSRSAIDHVDRSGRIVRHPLPPADDPVSITAAHDGAIWFGISRQLTDDQIGHITRSGTLATYRVRGGVETIAVGSRGHLWLRSYFSRGRPALESVAPDGKVGRRICADPTCDLEPTEITAAPDGTLWYGLAKPILNEGGGQSGFALAREMLNEAGFVAHLTP